METRTQAIEKLHSDLAHQGPAKDCVPCDNLATTLGWKDEQMLTAVAMTGDISFADNLKPSSGKLPAGLFVTPGKEVVPDLKADIRTYPCGDAHHENRYGVCRICAQREAKLGRKTRPTWL